MSDSGLKYEFTSDCITLPDDTRVHRIRALRSFGQGVDKVEAGQCGGYILKEDNLSHLGDCWVADNAIVCGNAQILENAIVSDNAQVRGRAILNGSMRVGGDLIISGDMDHRDRLAKTSPHERHGQIKR